MFLRVFAVVASIFALAAPAVAQEAEPLTMRINPSAVCFDERQPYLNFDLVLINAAERDLTLKELRALVLDEQGNLLERRFVVNTAWLNTMAPGADKLAYNPFFFSSVQPNSRIRIEMDYESDGRRISVHEFRPQPCEPRTALVSPLAGRLLVYDGHDFLSHHRRSNYLGMESLGVTDNFQRFALDLVSVSANGEFYSGDRARNQSWFVWDRPVRAAGGGVVAAIHNDQPDNDTVGVEDRWTQRDLAQNEMTTYGNYVLIDHGNGEFSLTGHLRAGSVIVRVGERVGAGQIIARVGNSGSSLMPHVHYELRTGAGLRGVRTMPPYFRRVEVSATGESSGRRGLAINTGDVVRAR